MTTVLTAVYNDYDELKVPLPQSCDTKWICVTDNSSWPSSYNGWEIVYEPRPHLSPNRASKTPKMLPWLYTESSNSIWIDASFRITSPYFVEEALRYADPIAQFPHLWRDCAYTEAEVSISMVHKYGDQPIEAQIQHLREEGHPEHWGLWACGVIARQHTQRVIKMGSDWLAESYMYSYQDQISHPDVCRRNGIRPANFPGSYFGGPWVMYEGSGRH